MKNLGAEANHEREWHRRHLEIWRENETLSSRDTRLFELATSPLHIHSPG